jgi:hypothetical protein
MGPVSFIKNQLDLSLRIELDHFFDKRLELEHRERLKPKDDIKLEIV